MFYKKIILSILFFASCSMNAMHNDANQCFLKRWNKSYHTYVQNHGPEIVYGSLGLGIIGMFPAFFSFIYMIEESAKQSNHKEFVKAGNNMRFYAKISIACFVAAGLLYGTLYYEEWINFK